MPTDSAPTIDARRALVGGLFDACFVGLVTFLVFPKPPGGKALAANVALFAALGIGFPTGAAVSQISRLFRAVIWVGAIWGLISLVLQIVTYLFSTDDAPNARFIEGHAALFLSVVSLSAFCAACTHLVCRAVPARGERRKPFQFTLAEALVVSVLFAVSVSSGYWLARLAPDVIRSWNAVVRD